MTGHQLLLKIIDTFEMEEIHIENMPDDVARWVHRCFENHPHHPRPESVFYSYPKYKYLINPPSAVFYLVKIHPDGMWAGMIPGPDVGQYQLEYTTIDEDTDYSSTSYGEEIIYNLEHYKAEVDKIESFAGDENDILSI